MRRVNDRLEVANSGEERPIQAHLVELHAIDYLSYITTHNHHSRRYERVLNVVETEHVVQSRRIDGDLVANVLLLYIT